MTPTIELVEVSKIRNNPYRDTKRNPIDNEKVEKLVESINSTDFWAGVYGRKMKDGTVQLAFGHHRLEAARKAGLKKIPITLMELSDGEMIMRMARENVVGNFAIMVEAVGAAVKALAEGKADIPAPAKDTPKIHLRYAPSFVPGREPSPSGGERPYTIASVAEFLGYAKETTGNARNSVGAAFGWLECIERKIPGVSEADLTDWTVRDALKVVSEAKNRKFDAAKQQYEDMVAQRDKTREEFQKYRKQRVETEQKQKQEQQKQKEKAKALVKQMAEAKREEDEREAKRLQVEIAQNQKRQQEREVKFKLEREELDKKVEERRQREELLNKNINRHELATRHSVKAMLFELQTITSETFAFREKVKSMSRNVAVTANERELLRQAMLAAGEWYSEWANYFLPVRKVDVLKEARLKEELKLKKESD